MVVVYFAFGAIFALMNFFNFAVDWAVRTRYVVATYAVTS